MDQIALEENIMHTAFTNDTKTGDIVVQFPMASQIFKQYKIDFCCGGDRPLGEVLAEKNLIEEDIPGKLNELYTALSLSENTHIDWKQASYHQLIDHVVSKHHAYLNQVLPELSTFVTKVYRVHGQKRSELSTVFSLFHKLKAELEHHLIQEEVAIFPLIKRYEQAHAKPILAEIVTSINELESEHEAAGDLLKQIREATNDFKLPEDACKTYQLTYLKLEELESDIFTHVHLENNILFPRLMEENRTA